MRHLAIALFINLALLLSLATPAYAMSEPDSVSIENPVVFQDLIETDDFLVVAPYNIPFGTTPDDPINRTYLFKLIDTDNATELGSILAYAYDENGYGQGVISFYFDSAAAPAWEGAYIIRVEQNPTYYDSPKTWDFPLSTSDYSQFNGQASNRQLLRDTVIEIADELELAYSVDLLSAEETGTFLSSSGETYFRGAIRGLQLMCPSLFVLQVREADYSKRTWDTTFALTFATQYAGTWVQDGLTGFAGLYDTDQQTIWGFVVLALCVGVLGINVKYQKKLMPGFLDVFVILILGTLLGCFSFILHGLIAFICVFVGGMVLFLNRA